MADPQIKTAFDYFTYSLPVFASIASFVVGKWWESRTTKDANEFTLESIKKSNEFTLEQIKNSNGFTLKRDKINNQRDRRIELFNVVLVDVSEYIRVVEETLKLSKLAQRYLYLYAQSPEDNPVLAGITAKETKYLDLLHGLMGGLFKLKTMLTIVGLEDSVDDIDNITLEYAKVNEQESEDPKAVDYDGAITNVKTISAKLMVDLRVQFDVLSSGEFEDDRVTIMMES